MAYNANDPLSAERRRLHGRVAALTRSRPADDGELLAARRALKMQRLEDVLNDRQAATAVQLTAEDVEAVIAMLHSGGVA